MIANYRDFYYVLFSLCEMKAILRHPVPTQSLCQEMFSSGLTQVYTRHGCVTKSARAVWMEVYCIRRMLTADQNRLELPTGVGTRTVARTSDPSVSHASEDVMFQRQRPR